MNREQVLDLFNRATVNNITGYDVVEALRLASPLFEQTLIAEINSIIKAEAESRGRVPGQNGEPALFGNLSE